MSDVLERLIEPPTSEQVACAMTRLRDLGAVDEAGQLTALGVHLASLPVDIRFIQCKSVTLQHVRLCFFNDVRRIGKLMLFGAVFRCLDPALTIAGSSKAISFLLLPLTSRVSPLLLCSMKMHALGLLITMHCVFFSRAR